MSALILSWLSKNWKDALLIGGCALVVLGSIAASIAIWWYVLITRPENAYHRGVEVGRQVSDLKCTKAREAAQIARDKQIAEIEAEERAKREALQARLDAQDAIITEKDKAIAEANARARKAAQDAQSQAMQDRVDSGTSCPLTGSVRDGYLNDVPAYNARHGH